MASHDSAEAWVVNVCHYVAVDEVKRLCRIEELKEGFHPDASQEMGLDEILPNSLSASDRDLLDRYYIRRETANEIACDLGETPAAICQWLSRLRKELRKLKYLRFFVTLYHSLKTILQEGLYMEYASRDILLNSFGVSDLKGLKKRLRCMPENEILLELDRITEEAKQVFTKRRC